MASISRMRARSGTDERRPRTWRSWSLRGMMASTRRGCPSTPSIYSGGAVLRRGYIRVFKRQRYGRVREQQQQSCKSWTAHLALAICCGNGTAARKNGRVSYELVEITTTSRGSAPSSKSREQPAKRQICSRCSGARLLTRRGKLDCFEIDGYCRSNDSVCFYTRNMTSRQLCSLLSAEC